MRRIGLCASAFGITFNFILFLIKLYVGISSNSLAIYCDAINNLGDTFACIIGIIGFITIAKLNELKSQKVQSLCTFVISLIIAVSGAYFVYNGLERTMYPLPITYTQKYAYIIIATVFAKIFMAFVYYMFNKKAPSPVIKALIMDSILDCFITLFALMGLFLITKVNFSADGIFAIITGLIICISSIKNVIEQSKFLINN